MLLTSMARTHGEIPQGVIQSEGWAIRYAAATDVGKRRGSNEDFYLLDPERRLFVLADGMGGHAAGEVAARLASETVAAYFDEKNLPGPTVLEPDQHVMPEQLRKAVDVANRAVFEEARQISERKGMGTTLVVLSMSGDSVYWGHVGDSRLYIYRDESLGLLTRDHSLLEEAIKGQGLNHREANAFRRAFPYRNVLTRSIGTRREVESEVQGMVLREGDLFVMTSDGIHDVVGPRELAATLKRHGQNLGEAARELIEKTLAAGAPDNCTVLLVKAVR